MTMLLDLQQISGGYDQTSIVKEVAFTLQEGEWLSLLGANGSGKSTLLKLISRMLPLQAGTILLDGKAIHHQSTQAVAQQMAVLPQHQTLPTGITVHQLVCLGRTPYQSWWQWSLTPADHQHIKRALAQTGMLPFRNRPLEHLSGGERQRAFLALALAQNPKVLLLDEPTTFLDLHHQLELLELLKSLNRDRGLTILTVLHDVNLAVRYSARLALLKQGQLFDLGPPQQVLTPHNLAHVFGITAALIDSPVGLQICAIAASTDTPDPPIPSTVSAHDLA